MFIRAFWILAALVLVPAAIYTAFTSGWIAAAVIVLFLVFPDVALIGAFDPERRGLLKPQRVALYNALHRPWMPMVLTAAGGVVVASGGTTLIVFAGISWLAHIAADRAFGYGLRSRDGSIRAVGGTHAPSLCQV